MKILHADSPTFAIDLAEAMGVGLNETIRVRTPQFERTDGCKVGSAPKTPSEWASLYHKGHDELLALGLGIWDRAEGIHYLYPKEWYSAIPDGLCVKFIDGKVEPFQAGVTDDDYRYGCLAFGFHRPYGVAEGL